MLFFQLVDNQWVMLYVFKYQIISDLCLLVLKLSCLLLFEFVDKIFGLVYLILLHFYTTYLKKCYLCITIVSIKQN